jgi:hypothetical protein
MRAATAMLVCMGAPAAAARQGEIAEPSRGVVTITAMVAGQAQLRVGGTAPCLWSNTATRLLTVTAADGTARTIVAAAAIGCTPDEAEHDRLILAAIPGPSATGAVAILVSPE